MMLANAGSTSVGVNDVVGSPVDALSKLLSAAKQNLNQKVIALSAQSTVSGIDLKLASQQIMASMAVSTSLLLGDGNPALQQQQQVLQPDLGKSVNVAAPMGPPIHNPPTARLAPPCLQKKLA